jgi:hypothetical protein
MWSLGLTIFQFSFYVNFKEIVSFMESFGILDVEKSVSIRRDLVKSFFTELTKNWPCML